MNRPIVEIFEPRRRGDHWAAAARVRLPDGVIELVARAPHALMARHYAKIQALFAMRPSSEALPVVSGVEGAGDFFKKIGKGFGKILRNPAVKKLIGGAVKCIPYVGSHIAKSGILNAALDGAGKGLGAKDPKKKAAVARGIKQLRARAAKGEPQARKVLRAAKAVAKVARAQGDEGLKHVRGLSRARALLGEAAKGKTGSAKRCRAIVRAAQAGNPAALEAAGYMAIAAKSLTPEIEIETDDWDFELGGGDEDELDDEAEGEDELDDDELSIESLVGAALRDAEMVSQIRKLRRWKRQNRIARHGGVALKRKPRR